MRFRVELSHYDEVAMGTEFPKWHRVAYLKYNCAVTVLYPIGIHLLVRWKRRLWEWSLRYRPSRHELEMDHMTQPYRDQVRRLGDDLFRYRQQERESQRRFDEIMSAVKVKEEEDGNGS